MEQRYLKMHDIETRQDENSNDLYIEGYFSVFDEVYEVWDGATESIRQGAFTDSINGDIRALYNHNTDVILGRTSAGTLELRQDDKGLWGRIKLNKKDTEAVNVYERIARGDITGCSFGFDIEKEERTASGIFLPDTAAKEKPQTGAVIAVGPGKLNDKGERVAVDVKVGDEVVFAKYSGSEFTHEGKKYLILAEHDVLAVIEK